MVDTYMILKAFTYNFKNIYFNYIKGMPKFFDFKMKKIMFKNFCFL